MPQTASEPKPKQHKISVRPETFRKYKRVAKEGRRTITETADIVIDEFLSRPSVAGEHESASSVK